MATGDPPSEMQLVRNAMYEGMKEGIRQRFAQSYKNPLDTVIDNALAAAQGDMMALITEALAESLKDSEFRADIKSQIRGVMAKQLIQKFGGQLEKQINALKADPVTKARITLAIDQIVSEAGSKT